MNKRLEDAINRFLEEKRKSDHGEYAEVTLEDIQNFQRVIDLLMAAKWDEDADGDYPIEVHLVNRHTHQHSHYINVPYLHKCKTQADFDGYIRCVMANASLAGEEVKLGASWISRALEEKIND